MVGVNSKASDFGRPPPFVVSVVLALNEARVLACNTANALRANNANVLALNKAHVLRLNSKTRVQSVNVSAIFGTVSRLVDPQ